MTALDGADHAAVRNFVSAVRIKANGRAFPAGVDLDVHHRHLVAVSGELLACLQGKTFVGLGGGQGKIARFGPVIVNACCHGFGAFRGEGRETGHGIL